MKKTYTINVDVDALNDFIEKVGKGNVSNNLNEYMKSYSKNMEKEVLDEAILTKNCEILRRKIANYQGNLRKDTEKLLKIREKREKMQLKELKEKEEEIKKARSCVICSNIVNEKLDYIETHKGLICHTCKNSKPNYELAKYTK